MDRYDEALAKARAGKSLEEIFPELNENEMVKKAILGLTYLDGIDPILAKCSITAQGIRDYLERLKEQPTDEEMLKTLCAEYEKGVADTIAKYEQKEQKPAEWSEEDREMLNSILLYFNAPFRYMTDNELKAFNWLRSLPERFNLQSKQEWNEEDEKRVVELKTLVIQCKGFNKANLQKALKLIDALRPQPREEIYQAAKHDLAIKFMNYLDENRPEGKMSLSNAECEDIDKAFKENDWEKIMRYANKYSWKPREEQMKVLKEAADMHWEPDGLDPLYSLYEDLKKLM